MNWRSVLFGMLLCLSVVCRATDAFGPDLLRNGTFSEVDGENPAGWGLGLYNDAKGTMERVPAQGVTGVEWALRLSHLPPARGLVQATSQSFPVLTEGQKRKAKVTCHYQGKGALQLRFLHKQDGKYVFLKNSADRNVWLHMSLPPADDWTAADKTWTLPAGLSGDDIAARLVVQLYGPAEPLTITGIQVQLDVPTPPADGPIIYTPPPALSADDALRGPKPAPYAFATDGRMFLKNGRPTYLLGSLGATWRINALWLRRVLDYDYVSIGWTDNLVGGVKTSDEGEKSLHIGFTKPLPLYSYLTEVLRNQQLPQLIMGGTHAHGPLTRYLDDFPGINEFFSRANHSFCYDFHSPRGRDIYRWGFENALNTVGRLPLLAYEIYREPGYRPIRPRVREGFVVFARNKYGDLAVANEAWQTNFAAWDEVVPPHLDGAELVLGWSDRLAKIAAVYRDRAEMYHDWLEYLRHDFHTGTLAVKSIFKQLSDQPFTYDCRTQRTYFDGYTAIDPERVADVVDIFFCHTGYPFFEYNGQPADHKSMLTSIMNSLLYHDFLSDNVDKPILNTENIVSKVKVSGSSASAMAENCLAQFHGQAKFRLIPGDETVESAWTEPGFDDSDWGSIPVPGPWDETEEYKGKTGWGCYRFHFKMPGGLIRQNYLDGTCRYLIYGKGVAQKGVLWLNGKKIGEPTGWNTKYQYDVSGLLNYSGDNTLVLVVDGRKYYAEGIRSYLHLLADNMLNEDRPVARKHYASMFWSNLVHGCSGNTFWHWDKYVHWYMPELKAAVDSAAPVVVPQTGRTGDIAMLYPYESFRGMINQAGKVYLDYMNYFGAVTFNHIPTDILSCRKLAAMPKGRYPLVLLPYAHLVRAGCYERVERFVQDGGTALITYDSLTQENSRYKRLPVEELAGIKVLGDVAAEKPALTFNGVTYPLEVGDMTEKAGVKIETQGADVLGTYADGTPAITIKKHGKGAVCYVAARLGLPAAQALLAELTTRTDVQAPLELRSANPDEPPYVEARVIGDPERFVLYLLNWGGQTHNLKVKITDPALLESKYRVRNLVESVRTPQPSVVWKTSKLRRGLDLTVLPQEPVALLFEASDTEPMPLVTLSPAKCKMLDELQQLYAPADPESKRPKALIFGPGGKHHKACGPELFPVVCQMLRRAGVDLHTMPPEDLRPDTLQQYDMVFVGEDDGIPHSTLLRSDFPKQMGKYLEQGGAFMLLVSSNRIRHNSKRSAMIKRILEPQFKVRQYGWCENPDACGYGDPLQIRTDKIGSHPVTQHVNSLQFFVASTLSTSNEAFTPLVFAMDNDRREAGKPLAFAAEVGNGGRIFVAGDTLWAQPERVEDADNLQFLANAVRWLTKQPIEKIDKANVIDQLIVSKRTLQESEK